MAQTLVDRWSETTGVRSTNWSQAAAVASALLLLGVSSPARASDVGSFFGGVVGGIISQSMQQPQPQPQPQYYQQQPQYYQQQPQDYQPRQNAPSAEARRQYQARQAEIKRQKAEQEKEKKEQEAAARMQPAPAVGDASGPVDVVMKRKGGNLWVPAQINKVVTIDFDFGLARLILPACLGARDGLASLVEKGGAGRRAADVEHQDEQFGGAHLLEARQQGGTPFELRR